MNRNEEFMYDIFEDASSDFGLEDIISSVAISESFFDNMASKIKSKVSDAKSDSKVALAASIATDSSRILKDKIKTSEGSKTLKHVKEKNDRLLSKINTRMTSGVSDNSSGESLLKEANLIWNYAAKIATESEDDPDSLLNGEDMTESSFSNSPLASKRTKHADLNLKVSKMNIDHENAEHKDMMEYLKAGYKKGYLTKNEYENQVKHCTDMHDRYMNRLNKVEGTNGAKLAISQTADIASELALVTTALLGINHFMKKSKKYKSKQVAKLNAEMDKYKDDLELLKSDYVEGKITKAAFDSKVKVIDNKIQQNLRKLEKIGNTENLKESTDDDTLLETYNDFIINFNPETDDAGFYEVCLEACSDFYEVSDDDYFLESKKKSLADKRDQINRIQSKINAKKASIDKKYDSHIEKIRSDWNASSKSTNEFIKSQEETAKAENDRIKGMRSYEDENSRLGIYRDTVDSAKRAKDVAIATAAISALVGLKVASKKIKNATLSNKYNKKIDKLNSKVKDLKIKYILGKIKEDEFRSKFSEVNAEIEALKKEVNEKGVSIKTESADTLKLSIFESYDSGIINTDDYKFLMGLYE